MFRTLKRRNDIGITNSNKLVSADLIDCDGSLRVTLALTAAPDIVTNPTDIALVLDRSGSMTGEPMANMKLGAKTFIDIISEATGGSADGQIGSGSRIGVVSFADTAVANTQLITSVDALKNAVDALAAMGNTNHADAFSKAAGLFDDARSNARVIVMFTDGRTTAGPPPEPVAADAKGTAEKLSDTTLRWSIPELGVSASETAQLEFYVRHTAGTLGTKPVNELITYTDTEGNVVNFPEPTVTVDCGIVVNEPCPVPVDLSVDGCEEAATLDMGDVALEGLGRIVQLDVRLTGVCPDRRVAMAVILTEVDESGMEYQRGMKVMTIPAHSQNGCRDVLVRCIKFVLPEDLDVNGGDGADMCSTRRMRARCIAHYIDNGYRCCESAAT